MITTQRQIGATSQVNPDTTTRFYFNINLLEILINILIFSQLGFALYTVFGGVL